MDGLDLSADELGGDGRTLEGVEDRDGVERLVGVEGLELDEDRAVGVEGLIYDETEAELVLSIEVDLFEKELYWLLETAGRVTELLLAGLEGWLFSDSETDS